VGGAGFRQARVEDYRVRAQRGASAEVECAARNRDQRSDIRPFWDAVEQPSGQPDIYRGLTAAASEFIDRGVRNSRARLLIRNRPRLAGGSNRDIRPSMLTKVARPSAQARRFGSAFVDLTSMAARARHSTCVWHRREPGRAEVRRAPQVNPKLFSWFRQSLLSRGRGVNRSWLCQLGRIELAKRADRPRHPARPHCIVPLYLWGFPSLGRDARLRHVVPNGARLARHMFLMFIHSSVKIDPTLYHSVRAGAATLYILLSPTMMGLHIRSGLEDTPWKYPHSD